MRRLPAARPRSATPQPARPPRGVRQDVEVGLAVGDRRGELERVDLAGRGRGVAADRAVAVRWRPGGIRGVDAGGVIRFCELGGDELAAQGAGHLLGVLADSGVLGCEVHLCPAVGGVVGHRVCLADEAAGALAVDDPGGEAVKARQVEDRLGCHAHLRARVGVGANHRLVDRHRDPRGLLGVVGVAEAEQEPALEQVDDALADLLGDRRGLRAGAELAEELKPCGDVQPGRAVGGDLLDDVP